jgi:hypothetical protein
MDIALSATPYRSSLDIPLIQATRFMSSMVPWPQVTSSLSLSLRQVTCIRMSFTLDSVVGLRFFRFIKAVDQTL